MALFFDTYRSIRRRLTAAHSIPFFQGANSRGHHNVPLWKLHALALANAVRHRQRLHHIDTFVQFAGFPRSGHSLIGSIIDAHPHARVSHELDTMGLLQNGFSQAALFALIDRKSLEFTRHGRYWNGFSYLVPGGHHGQTTDLRVIGDKKGDMAVRRISQRPDLLTKLQSLRSPAKKWILVLRNPFDNIATMSLRKGRAYDLIRTQTDHGEAFQRELERQQREGIIADEALDSQIDDYAALCTTVAGMKHTTPPDNWLEVCYEDFAAEPKTTINRILDFLGLPKNDDYVDNCCRLVNPNINRSRSRVKWPQAKKDRVQSLIHEFSFLDRYEDDNA